METLKAYFNSDTPSFVCLDINSCFATIEQQANPLLRGKPVVVTSYSGRNGCVLAGSKEVKALGVKTGMPLSEAKKLCPNFITLISDPDKYRFVHKQIKNILLSYTPFVSPKSIDEFILDFTSFSENIKKNLRSTCLQIKKRIKSEIGDYITVSIGIGPSAYLSKVASNLKKPDGLEEINSQNFLEVYEKLNLTDLTGIASRTAIRLNMVGIRTVMEMYQADLHLLKLGFRSILASYWYQRLRGYDAGGVTSITKSIGHTYTLSKASNSKSEVNAILVKLTEKVAIRLRKAHLVARGLHVGVRFQNKTYFHKSQSTDSFLFHSADLLSQAEKIFATFPNLPVKNLSITCFALSSASALQLELFRKTEKLSNLNLCLDEIKSRWGSFAVFPASMANTGSHAPDAIGFGNIP